LQVGEQCPFFSKVGACRYGDTCSRLHIRPQIGTGTVVMLPNMHQEPLLMPITKVTGHTRFDGDLDDDSALDGPDEEQLQKNFEEFFEDTHEEFVSVGTVVQFKVGSLMKLNSNNNF
jgi:hypothetical protein